MTIDWRYTVENDLGSWSAEGQPAITGAARRLVAAGRGLELAAIPADGPLVPAGDNPTGHHAGE